MAERDEAEASGERPALKFIDRRLSDPHDARLVGAPLSAADDGDDKLKRMADAFSTIIECLGEDPQRDGLRLTPMRAARALAFFTSGYETSLKGNDGHGSWRSHF